MDLFSPVAPARVRALLLPISKVRPERFSEFVERLRNDGAVVSLGAISTNSRVESATFSPLAFPQGSMLYDFATSVPTEAQRALSPFELHREPLLVLGLIDGNQQDAVKEAEQKLPSVLERLRDKHSEVIMQKLLVFDWDGEGPVIPQFTYLTPQSLGTGGRAPTGPTLKTVMSDISGEFLFQLGTFAWRVQRFQGMQSPGKTGRSPELMDTLYQYSNCINDALSTSQMPSASRTSTPTQADTEASSRPTSPTVRSSSPATSFDQIVSANASTALSRSGSRSSARHTRHESRDRFSVQALRTRRTGEKEQERQNARIGMVTASLYLLAGRWTDALQQLVDHATKSRELADHLWHAKGLENIVVCMTMLAWAGIEFQVPNICYPAGERTMAMTAGLRAPTTATQASYEASIKKLSNLLPSLVKMILGLYKQAWTESEIPQNALSELTIRLAKLLAIIHKWGELNAEALREIVLSTSELASPSTGNLAMRGPKNSSIGAIVSEAVPISASIASELPAVDHVMILAGAASVYATLTLDRKQAHTLKHLVVVLKSHLEQASKARAAEMGIHPAASLSLTDAPDLLFDYQKGKHGYKALCAGLGKAYGLEDHISRWTVGIPAIVDPETFKTYSWYGPCGDMQKKLEVLRNSIAFCEVLADSEGVLGLTSLMLRVAGPQKAILLEEPLPNVALSKEEQVRLANTISRTFAAAKQFQLQAGGGDVRATYWDDFLLRGIHILSPPPGRALIAKNRSSKAQVPGSINPLLYDPNSKASEKLSQDQVVIAGEEFECAILLQNPYDFEVTIEYMELFSGTFHGLQTVQEPFILRASGIQEVRISASVRDVSSFTMDGCVIQVHGCEIRIFRPVIEPGVVSAPLTIKVNGRREWKRHSPSPNLEAMDYVAPLITVIPPQPQVVLEHVSTPDSHMMLLEGETKLFEIQLRRLSGPTVDSSFLEIDAPVPGSVGCYNHLISHWPSPETPQEAEMQNISDEDFRHAAVATLKFYVLGKAGLTDACVKWSYCREKGSDPLVDEAHHFFRCVSVPLNFTVNAAVRLQHVEVVRMVANSDYFVLLLNVVNFWTDSLKLDVETSSEWDKTVSGTLGRGETRRIAITLERLDVREGGVDFEYYSELIRREDIRMNGETATESAAEKLERYNKVLNHRIKLLWKEEGGAARNGVVDLAALKLTPETLATARKPSVDVSVAYGVRMERDSSVTMPMDMDAVVDVGANFVVRTKIVNRSGTKTGPLSVTLEPRAAGSHLLLDDRRIVCAGTLQKLIGPLGVGEEAESIWSLCVLACGRVEVGASVLDKGTGRAWSSASPLAVLAEEPAGAR